MGMDDSNLLVQCDFEVFGHVQGSFECIFAWNSLFNLRIVQAWDLQNTAVTTA